MKSELDILYQARDIIYRGWTQGAASRDASGEPCDIFSPHACQWALDGALRFAAQDKFGGQASPETFDSAIRILCDASRAPEKALDAISEWNNREGRTEREVLALLDCAIAQLEHEAMLR